MKPWQATIPKTPSRRERKRCYTMWTLWVWGDGEVGARIGGKMDGYVELLPVKRTVYQSI